MIDAVREGYIALRVAPPAKDGLSFIRVPGVDRALLALDDLRRSHVLLRAQGEGINPIRDVTTLDVTNRNLLVEDVPIAYIDVTCLFESVSDVFDHFVASILERLKDPEITSEVALTTVLEKWRQFLTPARSAIGREKLASVFGELKVISDLVAAGIPDPVSAWQGPYGGRHDVRIGQAAIEVKTTMAHASRVVQIHGEDQLAQPDGGSLHLHLVRLEVVPQAGETVAALVDDLLSAGVAAEPLFRALGAAGVPVAELSATEDVGFGVLERMTFVVDEGMPRITPDQFVNGVKPAGVLDLTYGVDLDHVLDRALTNEAYGSLIQSLRTTA